MEPSQADCLPAGPTRKPRLILSLSAKIESKQSAGKRISLMGSVFKSPPKTSITLSSRSRGILSQVDLTSTLRKLVFEEGLKTGEGPKPGISIFSLQAKAKSSLDKIKISTTTPFDAKPLDAVDINQFAPSFHSTANLPDTIDPTNSISSRFLPPHFQSPSVDGATAQVLNSVQGLANWYDLTQFDYEAPQPPTHAIEQVIPHQTSDLFIVVKVRELGTGDTLLAGLIRLNSHTRIGAGNFLALASQYVPLQLSMKEHPEIRCVPVYAKWQVRPSF
ncbi:hypothetical protein BABINDRAFT_68440 [Babjeviella inositovora NRRL Y-12698]|uniref:Uncharacterized protein n=1 Tax=Babjeviella inositovora NRRL Y-12698 TaxID=984486 RepID=A0A1E3QWV6_9ASCO|nr:uncharacterized protein BABINDRAFT_68440 [Babjeviella inositovora NRRL Y-12698]ODQ82168.1 hypothetical protein BABINDRAFT_68440 [Babjeviella inositovora NRRL Y-12698]